MDLLTLFILSILIQIVLFIPAFIFQTDKLTDMSYSLTFILLVWIAALSSTITLDKIVLAILISLWGIRLGTYLVMRIWKTGKDNRFNAFRKNVLGFLGFWILQGITVWIVLIPTFFFMNANTQFSWLLFLGEVIFLTGFILETIADKQLWQFRQNKKNKGKFINEGLWKISRHPNFFGEMLVWTGVYIITVNSLNGFERLVGLLSPVFIICIIRFFSGVPPLEKKAEKKWGKLKAYKEYKKNTPLLIPKLF